MSVKKSIDVIAIEEGSDNPYADLGQRNASEMLTKATLVHEIAQMIQKRDMTQQQAAAMLGMPQPKISDMLRGNFRGISQARMIECLNRLGRDVDIVVKEAGRRTVGRTQVVVSNA